MFATRFSPLEVLERIEATGAAIRADGERLKVRNDSVLTDAIRQAIKAHKPELLPILKLRQAFDARVVGSDGQHALVQPDREIMRLWREAEAATGELLAMDGTPRKTESSGVDKPKRI